MSTVVIVCDATGGKRRGSHTKPRRIRTYSEAPAGGWMMIGNQGSATHLFASEVVPNSTSSSEIVPRERAGETFRTRDEFECKACQDRVAVTREQLARVLNAHIGTGESQLTLSGIRAKIVGN